MGFVWLGFFCVMTGFQVPQIMLVFGPRVVARSISQFWSWGGFISRAMEGSQGFLLSVGGWSACCEGERGGGVSPKAFCFAPKKKAVAPSSHPWQHSASSVASASLGPSHRGPAAVSHWESQGRTRSPHHAAAALLPPARALPFPSPVGTVPHGLALPMTLQHLAAQISSPASQKWLPQSCCIPSQGRGTSLRWCKSLRPQR